MDDDKRARETCRSANCIHSFAPTVGHFFFILRKSVVKYERTTTIPRLPRHYLKTILQTCKGPGGRRGLGLDGEEYRCLICMNRLFLDRGMIFVSQFMFTSTGVYQIESRYEHALECHKAVQPFDHHKDNANRPNDAINLRSPSHA